MLGLSRHYKIKNLLNLLPLIVLFSIFMPHGWYLPEETHAATASLDAWTNIYSGAPANAGGTINNTITVTSGAGRLFLTAVCLETANGATSTGISATLGGTALTQIGRAGNNREDCWMGYLTDSQIPAGGSTLAVTYASGGGNTTGIHIKWASYSGVDQTTPVNSSIAVYSAAATVQFGTAINYLSGGQTVYVAGNGGTPATESADNADFGGSLAGDTTSAHSSYAEQTANHAANGSYASTTTITFAGTTSARSAIVVAAINPVAVAGPGSLQFISSTYNVNENGGSIILTVSRTGGSTGAVGVSFATANDTALSGSDYTANSGTLSWADADTASKTITVNITNDPTPEPSEAFSVSIFTPTGGVTLGIPNISIVTITDDDGAPAQVPAGNTFLFTALLAGISTYGVLKIQKKKGRG